jgi:hypothetical protein
MAQEASVLLYQAQSPEIKTQYHKKKRKSL